MQRVRIVAKGRERCASTRTVSASARKSLGRTSHRVNFLLQPSNEEEEHKKLTSSFIHFLSRKLSTSRVSVTLRAQGFTGSAYFESEYPQQTESSKSDKLENNPKDGPDFNVIFQSHSQDGSSTNALSPCAGMRGKSKENWVASESLVL